MRMGWLALMALSAAQAQSAEVKRYVTLDGTRLLSKPAAFSKTLGVLDKGQVVWAEPVKGGYFKVRVEAKPGQVLKKTVGYIHARALQASRPKMGAYAKKSGDASAEEVAAATKGFNKQVEAEYKAKNAKLNYDLLDRLEARTRVENPEQALREFRAEGKLGEFAEGNADMGGGDE